ncbi:MAG: sensor histidine kinase [Gammaproteobacteria bacterium]
MSFDHSLDNLAAKPAAPRVAWWRRMFATPERLGYLPHVWLLFTSFFIVQMVGMPKDQPPFWICVLALVIFVPTYYAAYRREGHAIFGPLTIIALLGAVLGPINLGSTVFFHFAAYLSGMATGARNALLLVFGMCAWMLLVAWIFGLPSYYYIPGIIVCLGLVGISIHERQTQLADSALRRSQEEVHHLAQLAERERIARDLHDVVGHTLSMITLKAELASKLLTTDPERGAAELREIAQTSREALASVRETVSGYRKIGLAEQIREAHRALASANVTLDTQIDDAPLKPRHESMLALLVREAVTNVIRHAAASHCQITLARDAQQLVLTVADNGQGFGGGEGQGLTGMRERLAALSGQLTIESQQGTRLTARVPLVVTT